jgi:pSer/pThr/pTyr-binding forkhead associated (FHA) protein
MAGTSWVVRRFPVQIGRGDGAELRLEDQGIWDRHLSLEWDASKGFLVKTYPDALARVNGSPVTESVLRNGDLIEMGSTKIQFWLAPARQSGLRLGELLTWSAVVAVTLSEVAILYLLLK